MKRLISALIFVVPGFAPAQENLQEAPQEIQQSIFQETAFQASSENSQEAPSETATLLFKSRGDAMHVRFHTSTSETPCADLTSTATVYDAELLRAKLLPFIARMQQKSRALVGVYPEAEHTVKAGVPLQVLGQSNWYDKTGNTSSSGSCGPFTQVVTPQAGHKYLVLFEFAPGQCGQSIQDITDAATPVLVEHKPLECSQPKFE